MADCQSQFIIHDLLKKNAETGSLRSNQMLFFIEPYAFFMSFEPLLPKEFNHYVIWPKTIKKSKNDYSICALTSRSQIKQNTLSHF